VRNKLVEEVQEVASASPLANRWKVVETINEGGQSYIYSVSDLQKEFSVPLVLKRLKNPNRLDRFEREIKALQKLKGGGVPEILAYSLENPAFFVMPHYGKRLTECVPLRPLDALSIFQELCGILASAHRKEVIHRDLKPDNVLLYKPRTPIVIDFGLAYFEDDNLRLTATQEQIGSRFYMAPELKGGRAENVSPKVDSYALGKILYFMLMGEHIPREAFTEDNDLIIVRGDPQLGYITERLLKASVTPNPKDRKSAFALLAEARSVRLRCRVQARLRLRVRCQTFCS
jgi:serine/threonine protein kinase